MHIYCEAHDIVGEQREDVFYHVQNLDKAYLDWSAKKQKKHVDAQKHRPPTPAKKSR